MILWEPMITIGIMTKRLRNGKHINIKQRISLIIVHGTTYQTIKEPAQSYLVPSLRGYMHRQDSRPSPLVIAMPASQKAVYLSVNIVDNNGDNAPVGLKNNYVTSVGFQSDATGWGSIAIGSNAIAENSKTDKWVVQENGNANTSGTVRDDTYSIEANPTIEGASVALGYNAHSQDGNIAIGAGLVATATASTAKVYLTDQAAYVSVGGTVTTTDPKTQKTTTTTTLRRLTNVADGAADSDVATVGQLKKLSDKAGVNEGWGINIADEKDPNTGKVTKKNVISLNRNLGTNYADKAHNGDEKVTVAVDDTGLVLGGYAKDAENKNNPAVTYGATGDDSVTVGGMNGLAFGKGSVPVAWIILLLVSMPRLLVVTIMMLSAISLLYSVDVITRPQA